MRASRFGPARSQTRILGWYQWREMHRDHAPARRCGQRGPALGELKRSSIFFWRGLEIGFPFF
jgi:hypothetical protein